VTDAIWVSLKESGDDMGMIDYYTADGGYSGAVAPDFSASAGSDYSIQDVIGSLENNDVSSQIDVPSDISAESGSTYDSFMSELDFGAALSVGSDYFGGSGIGEQLAGMGDSNFDYQDYTSGSGLLASESPLGDTMNSSDQSVFDQMLDFYKNRTDQEKGFMWSAALGVLKTYLASDYMSAELRAKNKAADAVAKNAETNRLTYELAAKKQNNAMTSAGAAWPAVTPMKPAAYNPLPIQAVDTRIVR
jgi:hypothetical protein